MPSKFSRSINLRDSDFILTHRTCAIAFTADMSYRTAQAADFRKQRFYQENTRSKGCGSFATVVSQKPGRYLCFMVTRAT